MAWPSDNNTDASLRVSRTTYTLSCPNPPLLCVITCRATPLASPLSRTLGHLPRVAVVNSTTVGGHGALLADVYCGKETKLIYYLSPGEMVSRTFTSKDTHSTKGDLLVPFSELERVDEYHVQRARATTSILGFFAPSFS